MYLGLVVLLLIIKYNFQFIFICISGLIVTTARKLDRENQAEHILEVN